jgi:hypothetical protein
VSSKVFTATLGTKTDADGHYIVGPATSDALVADTTVSADIATLVADGATPTQGHVTTLNTDYGVFKKPLEAAMAADFTIVMNSATVTTKNKFRALVRELSKLIESGLSD